MILLNTAPYYDDFAADKSYHKIMFIPDRPLQSRELTQIQSIIHHQIKQQADFAFQNGAMVIPGNVTLQQNVTTIKLKITYNNVAIDNYLSDFKDKKIIGSTSKVRATVIHAESSSTPLIFIKYISGGIDEDGNIHNTFLPNEVLYVEGTTQYIQVESVNYSVLSTIATILEGVYYVNGYFVQVSKQSLVVAVDMPATAQIGLSVTESIVTALEDNTLYNNANGINNDTSMGADRLKITLSLSKIDYFTPEEIKDVRTFIPLLWVKDDAIQNKVSTTKLAHLGDILATRTFNESGNYVIDPFSYELMCYRSNNRGQWFPSVVYLQNDIVSNNNQYYVAMTSDTSGIVAPEAEYGLVSDGNINWLKVDEPKFNKGFVSPSLTMSMEENQAASDIGVVKISAGRAYIRGYEIDVTSGYRIATFDKAREYEFTKKDLTVPAGHYFNVTAAKGVPNLSLSKYNLTNSVGSIVGSCRIRNFEYASGSGANATYRVYVTDVICNSPYIIYRDVKRISLSGSFSANVIGTRDLISGSVKFTAPNILNGDGTLFTAQLAAGDHIVVAGIQYTVNVVTSAIELSLVQTVSTTTVKVPCFKEYTKLSGESSLALVLPHDVIRHIKNDNDEVDTSYVVNRFFAVQSVGGQINITLSDANESFISTNTELYLVSRADGSDDIISPSLSLTGLNNSQLRIVGLANGRYNLICAILKKNPKQKSKVRRYKTITLDTVNSSSKDKILLTEADVTRVISVMQSGSNEFGDSRSEVKKYEPLNETIVTAYYRLENTQNDTYYSASYIVATNSFVPSAPIRITYEYLDHSKGDFFSCDSYDMPFTTQTNLIDFKSRIDDTGLAFDESNGAIVSEPLNTKHYIRIAYSYYLPRRDIIQLDSKGDFRIEQGVASLTPISPIANDDNIILAYTSLYPYTLNCRDTVHISEANIKNHTMADIDSIAERLDNVESALSLNLDEKYLSALEIKDEFGLNRFKCGFIIDKFQSALAGGYDNADYKAAIDSINQECRPLYKVEDVKLLEDSYNIRGLNHYQVTGDVATLPYTSTKLFENKIATTPANITPLTHLRTVKGFLDIYPSYDTWIDNEDLPDVHQAASQGSFNSIVQAATQLGIIGTVWNAWQEAGRVTTNSQTNIGSSSIEAGNTITTTTTLSGTDTVSQFRSGSSTFAQESIDQLGSISGVVSQNWTPWARQKAIVIYGQSFMPNVALSVNIEQYDVSQYFDPSTSLTYSFIAGIFKDYKASNISHDNLPLRQYGSNTYDILERGEVIRGLTSGATAVLVTTESNKLRVINVKGTFVNETVVGLLSGATATITASVKDTLRSSGRGTVYGVLLLPNNDIVRLPTEAIRIQIRVAGETEGSVAIYDAHGLRTLKQTTILSVKNANILTTAVNDARVITENWSISSTVSDVTVSNCNCSGGGGGGGDPLAQTFTHNDSTGVFLTKIDLFFYSVKQDESSPIFVQIRDVVNGYPGSFVVPFSSVVKSPSTVLFSTTSLVPTTFTFQSPVFLKSNTEYCIVVGSNFDFTNDTKIWTSRLGNIDLNGQMVIKQPLMGSMFKSQNNTTWEADQLSDLCFTAYKAVFNIEKAGHIKLINKDQSYEDMIDSPFKFTSGSRWVRVIHNNHALKNDDYVRFITIAPTPALLNATFRVSGVTLDSFLIQLPANASVTGWVGGNTSKILKNTKVDLLFLNGNDVVTSNTHINYTYRTVGSDNVKPVVDYPIAIRQNTPMSTSCYLLSTMNEQAYTIPHSLDIDAYLYSSNPDVSPVLDLSTYSVHAISNRLNNDTVAINHAADLDTLFSASLVGGIVFSNAGTITITDSAYFDEFDGIKVGEYIVFTGTTSNNTSFLVTGKSRSSSYVITTSTAVTNETTSGTVTLKQFDMFVDSISAINTSNAFNYITRIVELKLPSTGIKLKFDYCRPTAAYINVYYKVALKADQSDIAKANWILLDSSYKNTANNAFLEQSLNIETRTYDQIMFKIEFKGTNSAQPPRMKNFRLISLA